MTSETTQAESSWRPVTEPDGGILTSVRIDHTGDSGTADDQFTPAEPGTAAGLAAARGFLRWGVAAYLIVTAALVAAIVWWLDGLFVYVLDDPAIHLSVAERLAHHGTWGVTAGEFQSASSSPLWTLLIAAVIKVAPGGVRDIVPLVLNLVGGVAVIAIFARTQRVFSPGRQRPLDTVSVVVLVIVVLFLPGLALVGMEHTLHIALVIGAIAAIDQALRRDPRAPDVRLTCALVALASLTRLETAFVALGIAVALIVLAGWAAAGRSIAVIASAAVPIIGFGAINKALGGEWLPNSILAKGQATGTSATAAGMGPLNTVSRLTQDPLLAVLFVIALAYLMLSDRRTVSATLTAITLVVATVLHVALADVGWYERYQAYLIAIGAYLLLGLLAKVPAPRRRRSLLLFVLVACVLAAPKAGLLARAPRAADDIYRHHYNAGVFLDRYYDNEPVATDQLGYTSLFHNGPITDFAGLGDHEALTRVTEADDLSEAWYELGERRGFRVVVLYDSVAAFRIPEAWTHAGDWVLDEEKPVTALTDTLGFYATATDEIAPLQQHLHDFESEMPRGVSLHLNDLAELRAAVIGGEGDG